MTYEGQVSISRVTGGRQGAYISITLHDGSSWSECVDIQLTPEAFGNALTGLACQECVFEWRPEHVGKIHEHKSVEVICGWHPDNRTELLKPFEVDGWKGREQDLHNSHCRTDKGYMVSFYRYVDPPKQKTKTGKTK